MNAGMFDRRAARLEGSCGASQRDWVKTAPRRSGIERIEAFFLGHAFDAHRHDTYAVGLTLSGVQQFDYRGAQANSTRGNLIVLHPDELHNGRSGVETGFQYRMAYLEPRLIRDALGSRARTLPFVRAAVLQDERMRQALVPLIRDLERPLEPLEADQAVACIADVLLAFDPSAQGRPTGGVSAVAVERARAYLDAHSDRVVTSDQLEEVTGLTRYEFSRQFRQKLGTSPYRYLTMRRLDRVRHLISTGESLADVAVLSGFADQSHLSRQFKRAFGVSPGRWRAMQETASPLVASR